MNTGQNRVIIDSGQILYSALSGNKVLDESGNPTKENGKFVYTQKTWEEIEYHAHNILLEIFIALQAGEYIGFVDYNFSANFRLKINPEYKSNRIGKEPPLFIKELKQWLIDEFGFIKCEGIESDDAVNISRLFYPNSIICSADQDLLSLEGVCYDIKNKKLITNTKYNELYKFWFDMIAGQTSDAIKGIEGSGKVAATEALKNTDENSDFKSIVLDLYCRKYGEYYGIINFHKNYYSLKMLDSIHQIPEGINFQTPMFKTVDNT